MATITAWAAELRALAPSAWVAYLSEHSGLPGPRANTTLVAAAAEAADAAALDELERDDGEFAAMCAGAVRARRWGGAGRDADVRRAATDARWRVREGVVIGLQQLGDVQPATLASIVLSWADDDELLVQRAAVAAICEPRLIRTTDMARVAIEVCARTTAHYVALPPRRRHGAEARTLRQTLGYVWSVAVAADPESGLAVFEAFDTTDPDLGWIVRENSRKKRLSALL